MEAIKELREFDRLVRISAALTGQEVNITHWAREVEVSHSIAQKWLDLLIHTYQWHETPPYYGNVIKRISKKPKGIFADTGLACSLIGLGSPEAVGACPSLGALFESSIVNQIVAVSHSLAMSPRLYHWRTPKGAEVDIRPL